MSLLIFVQMPQKQMRPYWQQTIYEFHSNVHVKLTNL